MYSIHDRIFVPHNLFTPYTCILDYLWHRPRNTLLVSDDIVNPGKLKQITITATTRPHSILFNFINMLRINA